MSEVYCTVNDCHYWGQGNVCKANKILVASDDFGDSQPDQIDATMASQYSPTPSKGSCMSTCCKSYVPRGTNKINNDNITKMT
ncbi:MAG: DUF1540 domain-containing protein [Clostridiales bacterium]|nr:DUF1540 domain-containing protein [Clostridiales bacterium]MCF8023099.1 DUF1540 domain-containing protein [Clostridiales bacterium]